MYAIPDEPRQAPFLAMIIRSPGRALFDRGILSSFELRATFLGRMKRSSLASNIDGLSGFLEFWV